VAVCPTGIDIRDGAQLECIQCALCIDACNDIMRKVNRPLHLIAYDSIAGEEAAAGAAVHKVRFLRGRTLLYAGLISGVGLLMLVAVLLRSTLEINVLHERNPAFVRLSDGSVRNAYVVKILNKRHEPREFRLQAKGLPEAQLAIAGGAGHALRVDTDDLRDFRVLVTVPASQLWRLETAPTPFTLVVTDIASGQANERRTHFQR
jgi:cytochrome c oxidase accessory protein FixG